MLLLCARFSAFLARTRPNTNQPVVTSMLTILKSQRFHCRQSRPPRGRRRTMVVPVAGLAAVLAVALAAPLAVLCLAFVHVPEPTVWAAAPRSTSGAHWAAVERTVTHIRLLAMAMPLYGLTLRVSRRSIGARSWSAPSARATCMPCRRVSRTSPIISTPAWAFMDMCIRCISRNSIKPPRLASTATCIWTCLPLHRKPPPPSWVNFLHQSQSSVSIYSMMPIAPRASCSALPQMQPHQLPSQL